MICAKCGGTLRTEGTGSQGQQLYAHALDPRFKAGSQRHRPILAP